MGKLVFLPISIGGGLLAGLIGKKLFTVIWALIDDQDPPKPEHRNVHVGKLLIALAIEGAIFSLIRGIVTTAPGTRTPALPAHGPATNSQTPISQPLRPATGACEPHRGVHQPQRAAAKP